MAITVNSVLELPASKKILILIGILCVITGIYFYLFFIPLQNDVKVLKTESNLEFFLFKPKPEEPQQFYARVPIDLVVVGSFHNTGLFFDKIGKLPRIINVVDFNMTRAKEVKGRETDIVIKTSCLITTYRFMERKSEEKKSEGKTAVKGETKGKGDDIDGP